MGNHLHISVASDKAVGADRAFTENDAGRGDFLFIVLQTLVVPHFTLTIFFSVKLHVAATISADIAAEDTQTPQCQPFSAS